MEDKSSIRQPWYSMGKIESSGCGWVVRDLLVRWGEVVAGDGYSYTAHRIDYVLPIEVSPGRESVEFYLEAAKDAIIALAVQAIAQSEGFNAD